MIEATTFLDLVGRLLNVVDARINQRYEEARGVTDMGMMEFADITTAVPESAKPYSKIFDYYGLSSPEEILALQNLSLIDQAGRFGDLLLIYELANHAQMDIVKTKDKDIKGVLSTLEHNTSAMINLWMHERMMEIILTGKTDFNEFVEKLRSLLRQIEVEFSYKWQYFEGEIDSFYRKKGGWGFTHSS